MSDNERTPEQKRHDDLVSMLGEGFHTAFRKGVDSRQAAEIHELIYKMPHEDWHGLLEWLADGLEPWLIEVYGVGPEGGRSS